MTWRWFPGGPEFKAFNDVMPCRYVRREFYKRHICSVHGHPMEPPGGLYECTEEEDVPTCRRGHEYRLKRNPYGRCASRRRGSESYSSEAQGTPQRCLAG